jgi:hypothetical protein
MKSQLGSGSSLSLRHTSCFWCGSCDNDLPTNYQPDRSLNTFIGLFVYPVSAARFRRLNPFLSCHSCCPLFLHQCHLLLFLLSQNRTPSGGIGLCRGEYFITNGISFLRFHFLPLSGNHVILVVRDISSSSRHNSSSSPYYQTLLLLIPKQPFSDAVRGIGIVPISSPPISSPRLCSLFGNER